MRIDRMLAITIMLLNRGRISARELAEKFEVSVRTVYRDIDAINMAGIPVISYPGNEGGFGIMENYKLDRQLLTLNDMLTILTALKGIDTGLIHKEVESAIEKIQSLVPKEKAGQAEQFFNQMAIDVAPYGLSKRYRERLDLFRKAITNNLPVQIKYLNAKGDMQERVIEPMTLIMKGYTWYLFAFCRNRDDYRIFKISRIKEASILDQPFRRRAASYKDYFTDGDALPATPITLKFSHRARVKVEDYFDEESIERLENGDMIVKVSYPEDEWVYSFILSYGEHVEVLDPPHLKEIIKEKARQILRLYNSRE
jgi:predicted DNA-binding transcriptional regulator YafY